MKKFWMFSFLGIFLFGQIALAADADIVVNEIAAYESSGCEWIELYNRGAEPVDIQGWKFFEDNTNHGIRISSSSAADSWTVAPGAFAIITQDDKKLFSSACGNRYTPPAGPVFDSSWSSLNEHGELIGLKNASGTLLESFTYPAAPKFSLERKSVDAPPDAENWAENPSGNTFGQTNYWSTHTETQTPPTVETPPVESVSVSSPASSTPIELLPDNTPTSSLPIVTSPVPIILPTSSPSVLSEEKINVVEQISTPTITVTTSSARTLVQVRAQAIGSAVVATGVVSALPGTFRLQNFSLSDASGGLEIYLHSKQFPALKLGDRVRVSGTLSSAYGDLRVNVSTTSLIQVIGHEVIVPITKTLRALHTTSSGLLVQVSGEITEKKSDSLYLDDGTDEAHLNIKKYAAIDLNSIKVGDQAQITGILHQTKIGVEIWPRANADLVDSGPAQISAANVSSSTSTVSSSLFVGASAGSVEKYLLATAGGLSSFLLAMLVRARGAMMFGSLRDIRTALGERLRKRRG